MIHLLFFVLTVVVILWLLFELLVRLLLAIGKPFADWEQAREAKRYAELRAAQEREYQEHMRAEDERARIKCALARIALECHQEK
jgi:hypothetical protein